MLGHTLFTEFIKNKNFEIYGTLRSKNDKGTYFSHSNKIFTEVDIIKPKKIFNIIKSLNPNIIINCIGIIKQLKESKDPILSLEITKSSSISSVSGTSIFAATIAAGADITEAANKCFANFMEY